MSEATATWESTPTATVAAADASAQVAAEPGYKVFAGNLTYGTDEAGLKNFFASFTDDIISAQIIQHGPRSAGYGFVTFKSEAAVEKAIAELDKKELEGRPVIVERARPLDQTRERKPRAKRFQGRRGSKAVRGETSDTKENGAEPNGVNGVGEHAAEVPEVTEKPKKKKAPRKKKTKTTAEAANEEGAEPRIDSGEPDATPGGATTTERPRRIRKPRAPRGHARGEDPVGEPSKSVLFVANLAFSVDEEALTQFFTNNGVIVKSARVVRWRHGMPRKSKGYGFVDVGDEAEQQKALQAVQGKTIDDREVTVRIAVNSKLNDEGRMEGGDVVNHDVHAAAATSAEVKVEA